MVVPQISISLAPPEDHVAEPYSPFSANLTTPSDDDGFRAVHLTPPPTLTRFKKPLSPLRPDDTQPAKGLERERFEALLQASRDRNVAFGSKKAGDLRKEIALKAHKNKQGLVSPLALFESLSEKSSYGPLSYGREPWVEQVDFRLPEYGKAKETAVENPRAHAVRPLPSLDQISARLSSQNHVRSRRDDTNAAPSPLQSSAPERPRLTIGVGRLQIPVRATKPALTPLHIAPPKLPMAPASPNLQVTTLVVPRSSTISPTELSEVNLFTLNSRERRAHDMLSTLRRRTIGTEINVEAADDRKSKWKRHSAPADLLPRQRSGFEHPVLALPGGF
ncbi:hypothetical protein DXG03_006081 [Asterophora parasitica]|uniref:Uncharacterized protein n=1 Tax=Asterophora parasitica TaxID=117018 RepID=A0A9P7GJD3_9AGAR|nr:hypothetical protein DXG03_006081 [Asterophora parasitica]